MKASLGQATYMIGDHCPGLETGNQLIGEFTCSNGGLATGQKGGKNKGFEAEHVGNQNLVRSILCDAKV
jgi:hypothetical protein